MTRKAGELVGRDRELASLEVLRRGGRDGAVVAILAGEAGIGKTRLARAFAERELAAGSLVLWGAAYEDDHRPLQPWARVLETCAAHLGDEGSAAAVGRDAGVLAAAFPALASRFGVSEPPPALGAEAERIRLHDAVVRLLAGAERPVLVVLDDLHWADAASLELLLAVARGSDGTRLAVVGTVRDVDVRRDDPLARLLGELARERLLERLALHGLVESETRLLLERLLGVGVSPDAASAIHERAHGNPFFAEELARHLLEGGYDLRGGRVPLDTASIPETVRHSIGGRVARLSPDASRLLSLASGFAGAVDARVLQRLAELDEEALLDALDEALGARLLVPLGGDRYEFAHALVREALYAELNPSRRARLHRRMAGVLEELYAGRTSEVAGELAVQIHRSAALPGAAHGIDYALEAAAAAGDRHARDQAVEFLRIARDLARAEAPSRLGDVLPLLAVAEAEALRLEDAAATANEAHAALVEQGAPAARLAELGWSVARPLRDGGAAESLYRPLVERALAAVGPEDGLVWARLRLVPMPVEPLTRGALVADRWVGYDAEAVRIARTAGDEHDAASTLELLDWRSPEELEELLAEVRGWRAPLPRLHGLGVVARSFLYYHADLRRAESVGRELLELSESVGYLPGRVYGHYVIADARLPLGDFEAGQEALAAARRLVRRLGPEHRLHVVISLAELRLRSYRDADWGEDAPRWETLAADAATPWRWITVLAAAQAAYAHAWAGDEASARRLIALVLPVLEASAPRTLNQNDAVALAGAAAWELGDPDLAGRIHPLAVALLDAGVGDYAFDSNELTAARAAALLGRRDEAAERFARARASLADDGRRPLAAIAAHDEALAAARAGGELVRGDLEAALRELEALGMPGWAARARTLLDEARAAAPAGLSPREVEVLRLLAGGRTNREIAAELVVSVHTVERHLANAYRKLGVRNRSEATAFALRHAL